MSPVLWCWSTVWEEDVGDMAVEVEPSYQYSITCCCCVTDGSRGALWQSGVWHGSAYEAKVCHWIPPYGKNCIQWHSLTLAEYLWRPNSGCEHSEGWVVTFSSGNGDSGSTSAGEDFYEHGTQALVHCWWKMHSYWQWLRWKTVFCSWVLVLSKQCCCALCICCSFHRNKQEAVLLEWPMHMWAEERLL